MSRRLALSRPFAWAVARDCRHRRIPFGCQQALGNFKYDLAIVDRMLPDGDALEIVMALSRLPESQLHQLTAKTLRKT